MRQVFLLVIGLAMGYAAGVVPNFVAAYLQNMEGEIRTLERIVPRYGAVNNVDTAQLVGEDSNRLAALIDQRARMEQVGPVIRVYVMAADLDREVAESAWGVYEQSFATSTEGFTLAIIGFLLGRGIGVLFLGGLAAIGIGPSKKQHA